MKKILGLMVSLALMLTLTACGSSDATETADLQKEDILIGCNIYSGTDNFMNEIVKPALEAEAAKQGVSIQIQDTEGQSSKLVDAVDTFINQGVNVLCINLVDPAAAQTIIDKAKAADIPLILYNKESLDPITEMGSYDKVWYVGTNSAESGIIQGDLMLTDWQANPEWDRNGDGVVQYVLLKGEDGHPDAEARTTYSVQAFTDAGGSVEELALQSSPTWNQAEANQTMSGWITQFGDEIELVISNNDGMALGAISAIESAGKSYPIYGVDALASALDAIKNGSLNGTVLNDGTNQGYATVDLAINAALGFDDVTEGTDWVLTTDGKKAIRIKYVGVNPDNVDLF